MRSLFCAILLALSLFSTKAEADLITIPFRKPEAMFDWSIRDPRFERDGLFDPKQP